MWWISPTSNAVDSGLAFAPSNISHTFFVTTLGDEGDSSESSLPSPVHQSESSVAPPITMTTQDGYSSGNHGDVSHANEESTVKSSPSSSCTSHTPTQPLQDHYNIAQLEVKVQELTVEASNQIAEQPGCQPSNEIIDAVTRIMWKYCHAYHINNSVSLSPYTI